MPSEWLPGVHLRHFLVSSVQNIQRIVRAGGCPVVMVQWQSTGSSSQEPWARFLPLCLHFQLSQNVLLLFSLASRMYISWFTGALSVLPLIQMKETKEKTATSLSSRLSSQPLLQHYYCVYVLVQSAALSTWSVKVCMNLLHQPIPSSGFLSQQREVIQFQIGLILVPNIVMD